MEMITPMAPRKIALLTDSTADLTTQVAEENHIHVVPLRIRCADGEYSDGVDIHAGRAAQDLPSRGGGHHGGL